MANNDNKGRAASQHFNTEISELSTFADVTVICDDKTWNLHRAILAQRSHWFKRALLGGFKEGEENCIRIGGWDKDQVGLVIEHIYKGPDQWKKLKRKDQSRTNHYMNVFNLGDYFLLPELKESSELTFGRMMCDMLPTFQKNHTISLPAPNTTKMLDIVREIYVDEDCPASKAFRPAVTMALHSAQHGLHKPSFALLIEEIPAVAADLLHFGLTQRPAERIYPAKCSKCHKLLSETNVGFSSVTDKQDGKLRAICCRCDASCKKFGPF